MTDLGRQIGERAQAAAEPGLLDLVREYGSEHYMRGVDDGAMSPDAGHKANADALFARIAALVPTLPVQARDYYGVPLWIHGCGEVRRQKEVPTRRCDCFNPDGPWRPLLVGGEPRPEPVQARDVHGALLWISETGTTVHRGVERPLGPWRPLLVAPDAAPDDDRAPCCTEMIVPGKTTNWCDCDAGRGVELRVDHPGACKWKAHERIDHPDPNTGVTVRTLRNYREAIGAPPVAPDGDRVPDTGCEVGADGVTCIVADRAHRDAQHSGSTLWDVATLLNDEGDNWLDNPGAAPDADRAPEELCGALFDDPLGRPQPPCRKPKGHEHGPDTDWKRDLHSNGSLKWPVEQSASSTVSPKPPADTSWIKTTNPAEQPQPDILREVMAALGVDRAEDVLKALHDDIKSSAEGALYRQQRDEARAEVERLRTKLERGHVCTAACRPQQHVAHVGRHALDEAIRERDEARWQRDELAELIRTTMPAPDPRKLRLPELPPGTVALIGKLTGNSYVMHGGRWCFGSSAWTFSELLGHEGEVTVELAPEPEPQQPRTAAEIWRGMQRGDNARLMTSGLAEALDREVAAEAQRRHVAERGAR